VVAVAALCLWAGGLTAQALWSDHSDAVRPSMRTGAVTFAAQASDDPGTRQVSEAGEPVTVRLPGSEIIRVLDPEGPGAAPVFWRFEAAGAALGITGLSFDVTVDRQVRPDGTETDISDGLAPDSTVLGGSRLTLYPAAAGGDCSAVPAAPEGDEAKNVVVVGGEQDVLQAPGTNPTGDEVVREWCVAMRWLDDPDGLYANRVSASASAADGSAVLALDEWDAVVAFPRSLPAGAIYGNRATVDALGLDGRALHDASEWHAVLVPDPSAEPDVIITLDPAVTNLNPDVGTGDQPVWPAR
jgi:hypothetical protein